MVQLVFKIILNNYLFLLKFMLILNVFQKKLNVILLRTIVHAQKNIKTTFPAILLTKLFVLTINSVKMFSL